jgi:predicted transcriptional regulator
MGSVGSAAFSLSDLLQTLSASSPQLSSMLSSSGVKSALATASPRDLVELSDQALQLQQVGLLFGSTDSTRSTGLQSLFEAMANDEASMTGSLIDTLG